MKKMPEKIWAWFYLPSKQDDIMQGGWTLYADKKEHEYIRADIAREVTDAMVEAAMVEFDKCGDYSDEGDVIAMRSALIAALAAR